VLRPVHLFVFRGMAAGIVHAAEAAASAGPHGVAFRNVRRPASAA
jgi:hypothetical protein